MKTREYTQAARTRHHAALATLHTSPATADGLKMWRALRRLETTAHRAAERYCNGEIDCDGWERVADTTRAAARKIFGGTLPQGFFVNGDPRGMALKIDSSAPIPAGMQRDWGGNGMIAATID